MKKSRNRGRGKKLVLSRETLQGLITAGPIQGTQPGAGATGGCEKWSLTSYLPCDFCVLYNSDLPEVCV